MKFTDLVAQQATQNPKYKDKTHEDVANDLYSQQMQRQKQAREELSRLKQKHSQPKESTDLYVSPEGELISSKNLHFKGQQYSTSEKLFKSAALKELTNLVRPLLGVTRAVVRAGVVTQGKELHVLDKDGKRTSQVLKDDKGRVLYNADPLSQLKMLTYVLESNPQTMAALKQIGKALESFNSDRFKEAAVTKDTLDSKEPVMPHFRVAKSDTTSPLKLDDADSGGIKM